jgi:hypothetical protein
LLPVLITQRKCAAAGRGRTTHIVDENVQAAETSEHSLDDFLHAITRADVSLNKEIRQVKVRRR